MVVKTTMTNTTIKCYSELITLPTFEERFRYLKLDGNVGESTFGFERYLNQMFYKSREWLEIRDKIIVRDMGCDLGVKDREIRGRKILVHHIDPITPYDIRNRSRKLLDPENLITTMKRTHDAITFGDESLLVSAPVIRTPNDTCPWKR